ncbi:hypothetical protein JCM5353_002890 [Sporobolomyces roseus]
MSRYAPTKTQTKPPRVDREKTCPSLLRVFVNPANHHPDSAFTTTSLPVAKEHQVYVWRDSTLREILLSLRDSSPALRNNNLAKYSLKLVFWDSKVDKYTSTELAHINAKDLGSSHSSTDRRSGGGGGLIDRTLSEAKYVVGDFLDIAYIVPGANPVGSGPAGHVPANGPQFAPLQAPSGPRGVGGGIQGARGVGLGGPRGGPAGLPSTRGDTWANSRGGGFGGASGARGGARFAVNGAGGGRPVPADQGWGNRRSRTNTAEEKNGDKERPPTGPRRSRRDSRSLSPAQSRRPRLSRSRSRSPDRSLAKDNKDRSMSPAPRRSPPPHMKIKSKGDNDDEEMKD